jgi:2Fe-2S ferredoxin
MATITFITHDLQRIDVSIKPGTSIMEAAIAGDVPGIEAQCYGAGVCGTCHVYAADALRDVLPQRSSWEEEMLTNLPLARGDSRLACQIRFEERFAGAEFHVPERQDAMT